MKTELIMKYAKNLKDLGITLEELYNNEYQINIHLSDKPFRFYVILKDLRGKIDCKISSYTANMWMRTNAGVKYEKYSRLQDLQTAIKKIVYKNVDTKGSVSFSISHFIQYM